MPIYEYRCEGCSHELEAMQKFSDPVLTDCPSCGKPLLRKLVSAAGFQLKGSGWYATDFKGTPKKQEKEKKSDEGSSSSSSSSDSSTGETPPKKHGCGSGGCGCH
jgi:putative FmdB family regulatory protein